MVTAPDKTNKKTQQKRAGLLLVCQTDGQTDRCTGGSNIKTGRKKKKERNFDENFTLSGNKYTLLNEDCVGAPGGVPENIDH